jgi:hypothetical protein
MSKHPSLTTLSLMLLFLSSLYGEEECVTCSFFKDSAVSTHDSALIIRKNKIRINARYIKDLDITENGYAVWSCGKYRNVFINKKGRVILWGVPDFDNGADGFSNGLIRIIRNDKYGYADRKGKIVIAPVYDGALPFENGVAKVCSGCKDTCVENSDCEHRYFKGGKWTTRPPFRFTVEDR